MPLLLLLLVASVDVSSVDVDSGVAEDEVVAAGVALLVDSLCAFHAFVYFKMLISNIVNARGETF